MAKSSSRRIPERVAIAWAPFVLGAAVAVFAADATVLTLANLVLGLGFALLLAGSKRSTGRLLRLLPRLGGAVLAVNAVILIVLFTSSYSQAVVPATSAETRPSRTLARRPGYGCRPPSSQALRVTSQ